MIKTGSKSTLTEEDKQKIWKVINKRTAPDDRDPRRVIEEDYGGDEEKYLRVMANWHNVPIGISG